MAAETLIDNGASFFEVVCLYLATDVKRNMMQDQDFILGMESLGECACTYGVCAVHGHGRWPVLS